MYQLKLIQEKSQNQPLVQEKSMVGQQGGNYGQQAGVFAEQAMRMSDAGTMQMQSVEDEEESLQLQPMDDEEEKIQMKCAECEEEEMLQLKYESDINGFVSPEISQQIEFSKGKGTTLPPVTNQLMSNAFGNDFSGVRIHTDPNALHMNQNLGARAFTVGNDIYFNEGQYNPNSGEGKHLLAHELTHTVQQKGAAPGLLQRIPEVCPPRPITERASSELPEGILPANMVTSSGSIIVQDFAVNSAAIPRNVTNSIDWQKLMSDIAGNPSMRVALQGHTDCVGSDAENITLRERRVASVTAAMPRAVQSKIVFSFTTAEEFLDTNLTPEGRARNRSVRIIFREMEDEVDACDQLNRASNIDELIFLVRCAEERLGLTSFSDARTFISALRQIYYGNASWTIAANRNRVWNDVIDQRPWSASVDPHVQLGDNLFNALRRSQVVSNIDIGHLLTGLDSMFNPHNVELDFGRAVFVTDLINEEWATWAGDVGSAAATWAEESLYAQADGDIEATFIHLASPADLQGDIDSFSIRQRMLGIADPALALAQTLSVNARFSDILQNYYRISGSILGRGRRSSVRDFIQAYGGIIAGGIIDNKNDLADALLPSIQEFAFMFFMQKLLERGFFADDHPPANSAGYLSRGVEFMTMEFIDWLEGNL